MEKKLEKHIRRLTLVVGAEEFNEYDALRVPRSFQIPSEAGAVVRRRVPGQQ
jgi:hypothetical protein